MYLFLHIKDKLTWLFYKACLSGLCTKASGEDKASSPSANPDYSLEEQYCFSCS